MPNLDERVASIEGRVQEHATFMTDFRTTSAELRQSIGDLRHELHQSIASLREEMHRSAADLRAELRQLRDEMDRRFDGMDRRFTWLVGMMVTGFLAVIGTVAGAFWSLLQIVPSATP